MIRLSVSGQVSPAIRRFVELEGRPLSVLLSILRERDDFLLAGVRLSKPEAIALRDALTVEIEMMAKGGE